MIVKRISDSKASSGVPIVCKKCFQSPQLCLSLKTDTTTATSSHNSYSTESSSLNSTPQPNTNSRCSSRISSLSWQPAVVVSACTCTKRVAKTARIFLKSILNLCWAEGSSSDLSFQLFYAWYTIPKSLITPYTLVISSWRLAGSSSRFVVGSGGHTPLLLFFFSPFFGLTLPPAVARRIANSFILSSFA